jgi:Ni/Fe-hydrogenase 1 B-type cytochrome subunit
MKKATLGRVFVWEIPVRFYHWLNFLAVVVLSVTGYLIGRPLAIQRAAEASFSYWFGTVRFLHFAAAYVFFFNFLFRIYWGFAGNRFASWKNFIIHRREQVREIGEVLKVDILQARVKPMDTTGFGMYSAMSDAWLPRFFAWVVPLMGGDFAVRQWHHAFMWLFILFAIVHVYLVFYHDYVEGRGVISSMAGGWKFIEKETK